jgi:hypothetical protein
MSQTFELFKVWLQELLATESAVLARMKTRKQQVEWVAAHIRASPSHARYAVFADAALIAVTASSLVP